MSNENKVNIKSIIFAICILLGFWFVVIISVDREQKHMNYDESNVLKIISSSENKVLENDLKKYANDNDIEIEITYADTLDIMTKINSGETYDAVWSSNSIWLYQIDSSKTTITNSKSLSINPVVFGIKKSKAEELGFVGKTVYTKDILTKIQNGSLKFAMSNPTSTNTGASAYLGILSTLAGNPEVLTNDMLNNEKLKEDLIIFFKGVSRTSGSEDFLEELFLKGDYEAVVTYESSIININNQLEKENKETLYAIYPVDGVSISDSTFAYIDNKIENKKNAFLKLQDYLLSSDGQKLLEKYGRRTWYGGTTDNAPKDIFNPEWGIDTSKYITPVKYPSTEVIKSALGLYQLELRKPVHVVFCLDYSGSMYGEGIEELTSAMEYILGEDAEKDFIQFTKKDKIDVIPFTSTADIIWTGDLINNKQNELLNLINYKRPSGTTAIYPAANNALNILKNEDLDKYNVSVILMTDGQGNVGTFDSVKKLYQSISKEIPIYSITFGSADEYQLEQMATLTNGKVFDGKTDLVQAFKTVRGYN